MPEFPDDWVEPYDLFISYCREDNKQHQVTAIAKEIETGHADFAPTQPLKVFLDATAIVTGELWQDKLQKGIRAARKAHAAGQEELADNCLGVCYSVLHTLVQNGCELKPSMATLFQQLHQTLGNRSQIDDA